ncbi:hypothetical protein P43SY_008136 [Pythium insidiosum]|uniref:Uncharacterized protein n=1 Tax=Pythium insidiosum TaxID=114742 RepID=A0AAD5M2G2_PYTIN|nr:hypothetical protein P43SY_008136 [Pythium insidiosum]
MSDSHAMYVKSQLLGHALPTEPNASVEQLYGHSIRIEVVSTAPVRRVVIDTVVHFFLEDTAEGPDGESKEPLSSPSSSLPGNDGEVQSGDSNAVDPAETTKIPRTELAITIPLSPHTSYHEVADDGACKLPPVHEKEKRAMELDSLEKKHLVLSQMRQQMQRRLQRERLHFQSQ